MKEKKMIERIERQYLYHGVHIKLRLLSVVSDHGKRFIFRIVPKQGTKISTIFDCAYDIKITLQLPLFQPFMEDMMVCLAVSETSDSQSSLLNMLTSQMFRKSKLRLPIALGYDMKRGMVFEDLVNMPHALYAGATNSGKSVGLICLILSLIIKQPVYKVNLILFDIGANTLCLFDEIPHLSHSIVKDADTGVYVIQALVEEMETRIGLSVDELRSRPALICVIDEYVSFINGVKDRKQSQELANGISSLIRRGRHAKIHVVLSTQDPTLKNMKVDIGSITTRMAFKCAKYHNSITILGEGGAEKLPGKGAMLFQSNDYPKPIYVQGAYISFDEAVRLIDQIKLANHDISNKFLIPELGNLSSLTQAVEAPESMQDKKGELAVIILWVLGHDKISASQIMKQFMMGNRANDIVDELYKMEIVSAKFFNQPRKVLPQSVADMPENVLEFLENNGFSAQDVSDAISKRNCE